MPLGAKNKPVFATLPKVGSGKIDNATGANTFGTDTNTVNIFTAGANGALVDSIRILSDDSAIKVVNVYVKQGTTVIPQGSFTIANGSGTNGTTLPVDALTSGALPISNQGKRLIRVPASGSILIGAATAVTAGKNIYGIASGLDFEP